MSELQTENLGVAYLLDDGRHLEIVRAVTQELGWQLDCDRTGADFEQRSSWPRPACLIVSDLWLQHNTPNHILLSDGLCEEPRWREPMPWSCQATELATIVLAHQLDVRQVAQCMRAGAVTVLPTPFSQTELMHWMTQSLNIDRQRAKIHQHACEIEAIYDSLSDRKQRVLQKMLHGRTSKWIAHDLDVSRRTIELDRADILSTFGVENALELAQLINLSKGNYPRPCLSTEANSSHVWVSSGIA